MSDLIDRLSALPPHKRALLEQQLKGQMQNAPAPRITPRHRDGTALCLSFAQERLWFLDQFHPGNPMYNLLAQYRIPGPVNVLILERCLNEIVGRHEPLRTTFDTVDGRPIQCIAPSLTIPLQVLDLRSTAARERFADAQRRILEEAQREFDLSRGPLLRTTLLRLGEADHLLVLVMHHIVSDAWSMGVFLKELTALYEAYGAGKPSPLPALPIQYADFAAWQREQLQGEILQRHLSYWRQRLKDAPPVLELPADRPRAARQSFKGAMQSFTIAEGVAAGLRALSQREGVTLFMCLLAAFKALLFRYTDRPDLVVGSSIANRNRAEIEGLIGFFVNTLVLRTDLSGNPRFLELLQRVKQITLEAYAHQDLPFEKLVEDLQPQRSLSYNPLVQVMFDFQSAASPGRVSGDAHPAAPASQVCASAEEGQPPPIVAGTSKFDLTLYVTDVGSAIAGAMEYNTDLFEHASITRTIGHFRTLLAEIVANPAQTLAQLPLLSERERRQILFDWNRTETAHAEPRCFHQQIESLAEEIPDAPALVYATERLSYEEFNRRANRLAHHLLAMGLAPEARVGVCLERTPDAWVALLAVLKAGGVYVPLDPAYPADRLSFMLNDAGVGIVLTQQALTARLAGGHQGRLVCLDVQRANIERENDQNPCRPVALRQLAYMIYTSGSTGRPKGVMIEHGAVRNVADFMVRNFRIPSQSRTLQFASLSFDASLFECLMTLNAGAALYLPTKQASLPGPALTQLLREQAITNAVFMPSVLAALQDEDLPDLQTIIVGGEACPAEVAKRWAQDRGFFNGYGPTEATILATVARYVDGMGKPSIGRPISNIRIYVLDRHQQPVPIGVPGEVHIGGAGVARGYWRRPGLTAEKFIPDPFAVSPGERLYKTGDLARYLPDGNLEFLGRVDHQVKVRGFRIEPGEIEAVLNEHPAIHSSAVVAREDSPGDKRLVAYVIGHGAQRPDAQQLRNFLRRKLPEHMIPCAVVSLEEWPLSANGKLDRSALPVPDAQRSADAQAFVAPRDAIERRLTEIWSEVLGLDRVGVHDNFFDLGGHSLLATQVISRLRDAFQLEVPLQSIFESPTVAELAGIIDHQRQMEAAGAPETIGPIAVDPGGGRPIRVDALSDEEVAAMLDTLLAGKETGP